MTLRTWPRSERPRERLLDAGPQALSDGELLAVVLGTGTRGQDAATLARAFPTVLVRSRNELNHMLLAFREERSLTEVRAALGAAPVSVSDIALEMSEHLAVPAYAQDTMVLTDDRAPVEQLTSRMLSASALRR